MVIGRKKIYYGWIIVAVGVIMMMSYGIVNNCISLYVVPICSELGFTRKAGAFMSTLYSAGGMLVSAVSSSLYQAMPVKKSMRVAAVTLSAAYFCYFFADKLWQFYIISAVAGCAMWLLAYVPYAIILSNWFHKRTGFVIGIYGHRNRRNAVQPSGWQAYRDGGLAGMFCHNEHNSCVCGNTRLIYCER